MDNLILKSIAGFQFLSSALITGPLLSRFLAFSSSSKASLLVDSYDKFCQC